MAKKVIPKIEDELPKKSDTGQEERVDEKIYKSGKYEITENEDFTIKIPVWREDESSRWVIVDAKNAQETHEVVFRMWSYEEEIELRKQATNYDPIKRIHLIDHDMLNRLKIQRLMKSWSFEKDNPRLKLLHVNGVMVDESFKNVMRLHPNILRFLIERMNNVLEYNG